MKHGDQFLIKDLSLLIEGYNNLIRLAKNDPTPLKAGQIITFANATHYNVVECSEDNLILNFKFDLLPEETPFAGTTIKEEFGEDDEGRV